MKLIESYKISNLRHWGDAFMWLLYTLSGGLLPFWGGYVLIKITGTWEGWVSFFYHGEFAIYSAALLAPTIYLITKAFRMVGKRILLLFTFLLLCISTVLFTGAKSGELFGIPLDINFLKNSTLWLFTFSILISYLTNVSENIRLSADIQKIRYAEYNNLEKSFIQLGE